MEGRLSHTCILQSSYSAAILTGLGRHLLYSVKIVSVIWCLVRVLQILWINHFTIVVGSLVLPAFLKVFESAFWSKLWICMASVWFSRLKPSCLKLGIQLKSNVNLRKWSLQEDENNWVQLVTLRSFLVWLPVLLSWSSCHKPLEDTGYRKRTSLVKFYQN